MRKNLDTARLLKRIFENGWDSTFIIDALEERVFTYKEFFKLILNCKRHMESLGVVKGDTICILLPNSFDLVVLYFASLLMNLVVAPIDPNKGEDEINDIISAVDYKYIICDNTGDNSFPRKLELKDLKDGIYKNIFAATASDLDIFDSIDYDRLFLISFTSGSTGIPKGVMNSFNNLVLTALAFNDRFNFNSRNTFLHNLPMTYMAGILNLIILPFISGSRIVIGERFNVSNIARFWNIPIKHSVNTFWFTPTIISLLLKMDRGMEGISYAGKTKIVGCVGTAPLNNQLKKEFEHKYGISLYESYGLSELLFVSTNSPGRPEIENSVGELLEGVEIAFDEDNEILIKVPWMFLGYSNVETESYFVDTKYRTGDIGMLDENGLLHITGRKKDLIIRGGINISPRKIENFIGEFNIFEEYVIIGCKDTILGEKVVCFFTPREPVFSDNAVKELNREVIRKLGRDYCIDEFVKLNEIPKNLNGKIDKLKIKELYEGKNK